jgi:indole-3-acetate monooxygenase
MTRENAKLEYDAAAGGDQTGPPAPTLVPTDASERSRFPTERAEQRTALLAAVEQLREVLEAGSQDAEDRGTIPPATVEALTASGLFLLRLPAVLGGIEADPVTHFEVIEALAYIDGAAAWSTMIGSTCIGMMGAYLPDDALATIFDGGAIPRAAGVGMPTGTALPVDGGYQLSGHWRFASGIRHSSWLFGSAFTPGEGADERVHRAFVFPTEAVDIHDNWDVAGLRGTGSNDFSLPERFIAQAFTWRFRNPVAQRGGPLYRIDLPGFTANEHAGFALGTARRALDTIIESAQSKRRGFGSPSLLESRGVFQQMVGESELRLRAARDLTIDVYEEAWATVTAGRAIEPRLQSALRAVSTYVTDVAVDVTTQAYRYSGGSAIYRTNVLQRLLRDINVAAQHISVSNVAYESLGQFALGMPDASVEI